MGDSLHVKSRMSRIGRNGCGLPPMESFLVVEIHRKEWLTAPHILFSMKPYLTSILSLSLAFILGGCKPASDSGPSEPSARPAKLVEVERSSEEMTFNFPAVFDAESSVDLSFAVGGQITLIEVGAGDAVTVGQALARLDQRTIQNEVAAATTRFEEAKAEFDRAERLLAQDAIARSVVDQRRSTLEVARTALDNARKALEDSILYAPFDGRIAAKLQDEGQSVSAGTPVLTLQSTGKAEAVVNIPSRLVANSRFIEPLESFVIPSSRLNLEIPALPSGSTPVADPNTQTFEIKFIFTPPEDLLILPGMTGTVRTRVLINHEDYRSQLVVPMGAVVSDGATEYVWRVDPSSMKVSRADILTGRRMSDAVVVLEGLDEGDTIVGAGASYLFEGMVVRPYQP